MGDARLSLVLYRSFLRFSRSTRGVPWALRPDDVAAVLPEAAARRRDGDAGVPSPDLSDGAAALAELARWAWRAAPAPASASGAALDSALAALRTLNTVVAPSVAAAREEREARRGRAAVGAALGVGDVFVHRKFGYRAVVYGWDPACRRGPAAESAAWAAAHGVSEAQPFYYALPDEADCVRLLGGVRISKYVAQENAAPPAAGAPRRVRHRALAQFFDGWDAAAGRYVPNRRLRWEYPADPACLAVGDGGGGGAVAPIDDDANVLAGEAAAAEPGPETESAAALGR